MEQNAKNTLLVIDHDIEQVIFFEGSAKFEKLFC